jgi:superoxide reductase
MKRATFYECSECKSLALKVNDAEGVLSCCGKPMVAVAPNTTDAAQEKHVPAVSLENGTLHVEVGSVAHPMDEDHFIQWVYVVTDQGLMARCFTPGQPAVADFELAGQKPISVFEYCNKHGLWKADL